MSPDIPPAVEAPATSSSSDSPARGPGQQGGRQAGTPTVRVFLSSPGDVADERVLARGVLDSIQKERGFAGRVFLEEVSWDDPDNPVALDARFTPQQAILTGSGRSLPTARWWR